MLFTEANGLRLPVHLFDDSNRLQTIALLTQKSSPFLISFLHGDANACYLSTSLSHQINKCMHSLTFCQKIIDNQYTIGREQIRF